MDIYLAHSSGYDFKTELYEPIQKNCSNKNHTFIFPHNGQLVDSKNVLSTCDLVMAEASYPSTGLGIELGWANDLKKHIVCIHKTGSAPSSALRIVCETFLSYGSEVELISCITRIIATN